MGLSISGYAQNINSRTSFQLQSDEIVLTGDSYYQFEKEITTPIWYDEDAFHYFYFGISDIALEGEIVQNLQDLTITIRIPIIVFFDGVEISLHQYSEERSLELANSQLPIQFSAAVTCHPLLVQTANINWIGGFCGLCQGAGEYSCNVSSPAFSDWNNGNKDFTDPLGIGTEISKIEVTIYGAIACGMAQIQLSINGTQIQQRTINDNCLCGDCESLTFKLSSEPAGYIYGGTNTLNITASGIICLDYAEIKLSYCEACVLPCSTFPYSN